MKKAKPVTREQYLKKFSRAVRWRLPASEAEEAIADYRELIFQEERDESKLVEELGEPVQAANLLTDVRVYRRWLWVFGILAFGLFLYAKWAWTGMAYVHLLQIEPWWYSVWVMAVGLPLSLIWFRRHGQKYGPLPKRLLPAMAVVLAVGVGTMAWTYYLFDPQVLESIAQTEDYVIYIEPWQVTAFRELLIDSGLAYALIALVGLVQAKRCDRRWLALYVLCVTLAAMSGFIEFNLLRMDVTINPPDLQAYVFARILPVGAVGLIGTGVALC